MHVGGEDDVRYEARADARAHMTVYGLMTTCLRGRQLNDYVFDTTE